ncbi:MAG: Rrf2 family transcriptional regulator [Bacillota bacterium]|nr:Rrf2 family transcriptional regulator [Bacillota bacterium]
MQLNQATDYALRAMLVLASLKPGEVVDAQTIATRERIPMRFLLRTLRLLVKAGIATSQRGVGGGYALARSPEEVTLLDVVEAVEGPIRINRCLLDPEYCGKRWADHCPVHQALAGVQSALRHELARHNFAELIRGAKGNQSTRDSRE